MGEDAYNDKLEILTFFLKQNYQQALSKIEMSNELETKSKQTLEIDLKTFMKYDVDLFEQLLVDFHNIQRLFVLAIENITGNSNVAVKFINLPESLKKPLWKIRSNDISKFYYFEGYIRRISEVKHKPLIKVFECPACGNRMTVLQTEGKKTPKMCVCGRKGNFHLINKEVYNFQKVILEEDMGEQGNEVEPVKKMVLLKDDLADPDMTNKLKLSYKVRVYGTVEEMVQNEKEDEYITYIEANNLEFLGDSFSSNILSPTNIADIKSIVESDENVFEHMSESIAPSLHGLKSIKKAMMLSMLGAPHTYENGMLVERGNVDILLVSPPGMGKSDIMKRINLIIPGSRYASGSTASGVGLIATVQKDELLGGWSLFPGAIPLAHKSTILIDELDKISSEDMGYLNQAIDKLEIQVDKASIHVLLQSDVTVIAAANPRHKVFDPNKPIWLQFNNLNKDLVDRFDLVFATPRISKEEHSKVLDKIFNRFLSNESNKVKYSIEQLRHYILYARTIKPKLTEEAHKYLRKEYSAILDPDGLEEGVYLSNRIVPAIIRLTIAAARSRFSKEATIEDAKVAIFLLKESLRSIDVLKKGVFDTFTYERAVPSKSINKVETILKTIEELDSGSGAEQEKLYSILEDKGLTKTEIGKLLISLSNEGSLFSPRTGLYKLL